MPTRGTAYESLASVAELLDAARYRLGRNSPTPRLDAELLLSEVLGCNRAGLIVAADCAVPAAQRRRFEHLVAERADGMPIAYLLGRREFWSLDLRVNAHTLIPRPETELLVETALALIPAAAQYRIADLGTGSGAIALAIAGERPHCRIVAVDVSALALAVARGNAERLGLTGIEFRRGDWFGPLADSAFDLIVSNPPYVAANDPHLGEGDLRFEPALALIAGDDGMQAIRQIAAGAGAHLRDGGWLLIEHGGAQGLEVREVLQQHGFSAGHTRCDLSGLERVTSGQWPAHA